jgi:hypothetical protein
MRTLSDIVARGSYTRSVDAPFSLRKDVVNCTKTYARSRRQCKCLVGAIMLSGFLGASVRAQGGPPYITDDPDTPGANNWEINTAVIGARSNQHWDLAAPDLDINYGWGEHVQLKLDVNWASALASDGRLISGFGATDFGVKWRLVDQDKYGFALSVYPQLLTNLLPSSAARGLTTDDREFFLPAEFSTDYGAFHFDAELGRNFVQRGPDAWIGGVIVAHTCAPALECGVELHGTLIGSQIEPLANFGVHWTITKHLVVLAAAGREFGSNFNDHQGFLFYFGLQFLKES